MKYLLIARDWFILLELAVVMLVVWLNKWKLLRKSVKNSMPLVSRALETLIKMTTLKKQLIPDKRTISLRHLNLKLFLVTDKDCLMLMLSRKKSLRPNKSTKRLSKLMLINRLKEKEKCFLTSKMLKNKCNRPALNTKTCSWQTQSLIMTT